MVASFGFMSRALEEKRGEKKARRMEGRPAGETPEQVGRRGRQKAPEGVEGAAL